MVYGERFVQVDVVIDGKRRFLEARADENAAAAASRFCRLHGLTARDCNKIADEIQKKQRREDAAVEEESVSSKIPARAVDHSTPDYSRRLEPRLAVVWRDKPTQLFRYDGETVDNAVDRFCHRLHMDETSCSTVRHRFTCLVNNTECPPSLEEEKPLEPSLCRRLFYRLAPLLIAFAVVLLQGTAPPPQGGEEPPP